ncbi:MAG TPA: hypothetical protein DGT21_25065 [Armatimonadetes bacterium]|jgi:L-alanine-DL-glutamate epimerase-like enolase superfamily enzyme|nr:hypothetical protein [Armatimonadota bacterium]
MVVTGVEPYAFTYPLNTPLPPSVTRPIAEKLDIHLVRVTTDTGLHGWGEAWLADEADFAPAVETLSELVTGHDPTDRGLLWYRMASVAAGREARDTGPQGRRDFHAVLSAIDTALWDIVGKALGVSVARLLGGVRSPRLDTYVTGLYLEPEAVLVQKAKQIVAEGFRGIKMKLRGDLEADVAAVRAVRAALGNQVVLMADANGAYDGCETVLELGLALAKDDIYWLEEPFKAGAWGDYARVARALEPPIAGGETLYSTEVFHEAITAGAMHVAMPDPRLCGGITAARTICEVAAMRQVRVSFHNWVSPVALMASANVSAAMPYAERLELEGSRTGLAAAMLTEPPVFEQGFMRFEDKPGLGMDVAEAFISEYGRDIVES